MNIETYLKQSKNTAPSVVSAELGRGIYPTDVSLLISLCSQVIVACDAADVIKRSIFYREDAKKSGERLQSATQELRLVVEELEQFQAEGKAQSITLSSQQIDLIHSALGHVSESGETLIEIIKSVTEQRPMDEVNLREEAGDKMWYSALEMRALGTNFELEGAKNIDKLAARYPEKFDCDKALNRDLKKEREILES